MRLAKSQLAEMYLSEENISQKSKLNLLKQWINEDTSCIADLEKTKNYNKKAHYYTREQVCIIYKHIGFPCQANKNGN